jgi:hypothetical protein
MSHRDGRPGPPGQPDHRQGSLQHHQSCPCHSPQESCSAAAARWLHWSLTAQNLPLLLAVSARFQPWMTQGTLRLPPGPPGVPPRGQDRGPPASSNHNEVYCCYFMESNQVTGMLIAGLDLVARVVITGRNRHEPVMGTGRYRGLVPDLGRSRAVHRPGSRPLLPGSGGSRPAVGEGIKRASGPGRTGRARPGGCAGHGYCQARTECYSVK